MTYKLGSLFDGSGGFPLAGALCGIEPVWAAEVEPYPIAVTRTRFPNMRHLGDISKVNGAEIEPVDIITFGSPCQDLSVAGKRAGLKHEANGDEETTRSGLFMEAVRIIKEMREATGGAFPRWALWENVPGAFSSNKGEDFRVVCEELIKIVEPRAFMPEVPKNGWAYADSYIGDGWSLAYRVFDAQYWGVAQRRRRIHLIVDFAGECAREVLFEREGVRGYFAEGRTPWQAAPSHAQGRSGADDREGESAGGLLCPSGAGYSDGLLGGRQLDDVKAYTLKIRSGCAVDSSGKAAGKGALVQTELAATLATSQDQYFFQPMLASGKDVTGCLMASGYEKLGAQEMFSGDYTVLQPVAYSFDSLASNSMKSSNPHSGCRAVEVAKTLDTTDPNPCKNQGGIAIVEPVTIIDNIGGQAEYAKDSQVNGTLRAGAQGAVGYVVAAVENHPADSRVNIDESGVVQTLTSRMGTGGGNVPMVLEGQPVFCLQGNGIDRADTAGCNGKGWKEDQSYTLNTVERPAVCYALDRASFNQGQNAKYDFEISDSGVNSTLVARGPSAVAYCTDVGWLASAEEQAPTLLARQYKDPHLVSYSESELHYIVRRLTPTECARLQGFADQWGHLEQKAALTDEEYKFWLEVRNTHASINGKVVKDYTPAQMLAYYNKLWTDGAEYKMWGNGIALPPALYCMQGMVEVMDREDDDSWLM